MLGRFIVAITLFVCVSSLEEIPSWLKVCNKDDPEMERCIMASGDELRPYLVTGVPEYDIPALEPLVINELIKEDQGGLHLEATNVKAWGCTDYFVRKANWDLDKHVYELDVDLPLLKIEARYNASGKIMVMPIRGEGPMKANVTNCHAKVRLLGELHERDGDTYLKFTEMTIKVEVEDGIVKVENLFNGDKLLNDIVNDTINKNLGAFLAELMPVIEKALGSTFLDIANQIVKRFTFKQLFPH